MRRHRPNTTPEYTVGDRVNYNGRYGFGPVEITEKRQIGEWADGRPKIVYSARWVRKGELAGQVPGEINSFELSR